MNYKIYSIKYTVSAVFLIYSSTPPPQFIGTGKESCHKYECCNCEINNLTQHNLVVFRCNRMSLCLTVYQYHSTHTYSSYGLEIWISLFRFHCVSPSAFYFFSKPFNAAVPFSPSISFTNFLAVPFVLVSIL